VELKRNLRIAGRKKEQQSKVKEESNELKTKKENNKLESDTEKASEDKEEVSPKAPSQATTPWNTLFPMHPNVLTGPYQEGNNAIPPASSDTYPLNPQTVIPTSPTIPPPPSPLQQQ